MSVPSDVLGSVVEVSGAPRSGTMGTDKVPAEGEIRVSSTSGLFEFGIRHSHSRSAWVLPAMVGVPPLQGPAAARELGWDMFITSPELRQGNTTAR